MKITKFLSVAILLAGLMPLTSCGGKTEKKDDTIKVKPATTEVSGPLGEYFTVVDREYTAKLEEFTGGVIAIEIKRNDDNLEMPWASEDVMVYSYSAFSASRYVQVGFGIEFLDADGNIVGKTSPSGSGLSGSYDPDECVELVKLRPGQTGSIRFHVDEECVNAVSFRISSDYQYGGSDDGSSIYDSMTEESSTETYDGSIVDTDGDNDNAQHSSENWDSILDAYEDFINEYIPFCNKVAQGEIEISDPEYSRMTQRAMSFASKMQNAEPSDMTAAQYSRLTNLASRAATAASKMY